MQLSLELQGLHPNWGWSHNSYTPTGACLRGIKLQSLVRKKPASLNPLGLDPSKSLANFGGYQSFSDIQLEKRGLRERKMISCWTSINVYRFSFGFSMTKAWVSWFLKLRKFEILRRYYLHIFAPWYWQPSSRAKSGQVTCDRAGGPHQSSLVQLSEGSMGVDTTDQRLQG